MLTDDDEIRIARTGIERPRETALSIAPFRHDLLIVGGGVEHLTSRVAAFE
jgi:hypothetical protein